MKAVDEPGFEWPTMAIELQCDSCGALVFSEVIRPLTLAAYPSIAWHWRDRMLAHVESCPRTPPKTGESGRSTSAPAETLSTGPEDKTPVERPDSNKTGRSDVEE